MRRVVLVRDSQGRMRIPRLRVAAPRAVRARGTSRRGSTTRRAQQNTIMMTVGAPNPQGRRAVRNKSTKSFREYTVDLNKVNMTPLLEKAIDRWNTFQSGKPPKRVRVYEYDDGKEGVEEKVCFRIGESQITVDTVEDEHGKEVRIKPLEIGMVYKGEKASGNKKNSNWIHSYKEDGGKPPINVVDVETGIMMQLGGTYEALDWMRR